jgi:hypothetical protein
VIVFGTLVTLLFIPDEFRKQLEFYGCSKTGTVVNYTEHYLRQNQFYTGYTVTIKCKYGNQTISPLFEDHFKVEIKQ